MKVDDSVSVTGSGSDHVTTTANVVNSVAISNEFDVLPDANSALFGIADLIYQSDSHYDSDDTNNNPSKQDQSTKSNSNGKQPTKTQHLTIGIVLLFYYFILLFIKFVFVFIVLLFYFVF